MPGASLRTALAVRPRPESCHVTLSVAAKYVLEGHIESEQSAQEEEKNKDQGLTRLFERD